MTAAAESLFTLTLFADKAGEPARLTIPSCTLPSARGDRARYCFEYTQPRGIPASGSMSLLYRQQEVQGSTPYTISLPEGKSWAPVWAQLNTGSDAFVALVQVAPPGPRTKGQPTVRKVMVQARLDSVPDLRALLSHLAAPPGLFGEGAAHLSLRERVLAV